MAQRVIRLVVEPPDGVRVVFTSPAPFLAGTARMYLNGVLQRLDYVTELSMIQVRVEEPPQGGPIPDSLEISFVPI